MALSDVVLLLWTVVPIVARPPPESLQYAAGRRHALVRDDATKHVLFGVPSRPSITSGGTESLLERLRAGSQESSETEDEDEDEDEDETDDDDTDDDDTDDEEEGDDDKDETDASNKKDEARLSTPVPVAVQTRYCGTAKTTILDQKVELTMQRRRTVAMLKQGLRRALPNKPPTSLMQIVYEGRILGDGVLLDAIVEDDEEDDDDEELEDDSEEAKGTLHLTLDMIPPVDGKFTQSMSEQLKDLTTSELLQLFATNEAALHEATLSRFQPLGGTNKQEEDDDEDDSNDEVEENDDSVNSVGPKLVVPQILERASQIEQQLRDLLQQDGDKVQSILNETRPPSAIQAVTEIRGERVKDAVPSHSVKTSLRRKLQHNFNVQSWPDTIRYISLFVFFGLFGGRTPMARFLLLLGAPSVLVLQARPVKLLWKQVLYTLLINPPGILLSLLPAPQQALFELDKEKAMQTIYGPYTTETKDMQQQPVTEKKRRTLVAKAENDEEFFDAEEDEFFDTKETDDDEDDDEDEDDDSDDSDEDSDDDDDDDDD